MRLTLDSLHHLGTHQFRNAPMRARTQARSAPASDSTSLKYQHGTFVWTTMPYLGTTTFIVVLVGTLLVALVGWWLLVRALAPAFVIRATDRWQRRLRRTQLPAALFGQGLLLWPVPQIDDRW